MFRVIFSWSQIGSTLVTLKVLFAGAVEYCFVEECDDSEPCGLNTDLLPTNKTVELICATGVHVTRSGGSINPSDRLSDEECASRCEV